MKNPTSRQGNSKTIAIIVIAIVVVIVLAVVFSMLSSNKTIDLGSNAPVMEGYQAIFLSNGQVYFGKVSDLDNEYVKINEIYYLQRKQPVQAQTPPDEGEAAAAQPKLTLIKLGEELHGPKDVMYINQKHVLFVENLKDESKIVEAINLYKERQEATEEDN